MAQLARSMLGQYSDTCYVQIGGYAARPEDWAPAAYPSVRLRPDELAITRIGQTYCLYRFALADLHAELLHEQRQPRLF